MSKVWYCTTCGYEVGFRGRCHRCRQRLELSPLPEMEVGSEEDEVGYRLDDWADEARGLLIAELITKGISHRFEDDELVVDVASEEQVDEVVGRLAEAAFVESGDDEADDEADEVIADDELISAGGVTPEMLQLAAAAERLSVDPTDMEADAEASEASAAVFMTDEPTWVDPGSWAAVGRVTRRLMAALSSDDALEDEIRTQAGILARLLVPVVHPAGAEPSLVDASPATIDAATIDAAAGADDDGSVSASPDGAEAPGSGAGPAGDDPADEASSNDTVTADRPASATGRPGRSETVYELGEWLPEQRAELAMLLDAGHITNTWDGENLVVASDREADVEQVLDRIEAVDDADADEEATYRAMEELFAATDRFVGDPSDRSRGNEVVRAVGVADRPTPVGLDDAQWWQIRQRARILADSIEHKAQKDVVLGEARTLRDLLRGLM